MEAQDILDLWFPKAGFWRGPETFKAWMEGRMYGGMDAVICRDDADVTRAAARGDLDPRA
ncbi:MAG: hypothetical protein AAFP13_16345 [Pseudomonadota bacterium]